MFVRCHASPGTEESGQPPLRNTSFFLRYFMTNAGVYKISINRCPVIIEYCECLSTVVQPFPVCRDTVRVDDAHADTRGSRRPQWRSIRVTVTLRPSQPPGPAPRGRPLPNGVIRRMRKQGLVHLHALCAQLRTHVEERAEVPDGAFDRYEELDVSPSAIYRRKESHRRAVQRLADDVSTAVELEQQLPDGPTATDGGSETERKRR